MKYGAKNLLKYKSKILVWTLQIKCIVAQDLSFFCFDMHEKAYDYEWACVMMSVCWVDHNKNLNTGIFQMLFKQDLWNSA